MVAAISFGNSNGLVAKYWQLHEVVFIQSKQDSSQLSLLKILIRIQLKADRILRFLIRMETPKSTLHFKLI